MNAENKCIKKYQAKTMKYENGIEINCARNLFLKICLNSLDIYKFDTL